MNNSKIEWCNHTINFWHGCTKVSTGCQNCYAESLDKRKLLEPATHWGKGVPRLDRITKARTEAIKLNKKAVKNNTRYKIFANSMSDWLDEEIPIKWLEELLDTIRLTPNLDWLLLTKRPEKFDARIRSVINISPHSTKRAEIVVSLREWLKGYPPENVWLGTSVENQRMADKRIPELLNIPTKVRFLSCEPLLEEVDVFLLGKWQVDWLIVGGESGAGARKFDPDWVRRILEESRGSGLPNFRPKTAFFMKQMGGTRKPFPEIPADLQVREFPKVRKEVKHG